MMTQMLLPFHKLIFHFAPLGQASHVFTSRGAGGGPRGWLRDPSHHLPWLLAFSQQQPGVEQTRKPSAWSLMDGRGCPTDEPLIHMALRRTRAIITVIMNWRLLCARRNPEDSTVLAHSFNTIFEDMKDSPQFKAQKPGSWRYNERVCTLQLPLTEHFPITSLRPRSPLGCSDRLDNLFRVIQAGDGETET